MKTQNRIYNFFGALPFMIILLLMICAHNSNAQKLPIDTSVLGRWPVISPFRTGISNNGEFIFYFIDNQPYHHTTFVIQNTDNTWKKEFIDISDAPFFFTANNQQCVFLSHDTLYFQKLGGGLDKLIAHVTEYAAPETKKGKWLAYKTTNSPDSLVLMDLSTNRAVGFSFIKHFQFERNGKSLLLKKVIKANGVFKEELQFVDLSDNRAITFWSDTSNTEREISSDYSFDDAGSQLAFVVDEFSRDKNEKQIWYYKAGASEAVLRVTNDSKGIDPDLIIAGSPKFSKTGRWLFFDLREKTVIRASIPGKSQVHVWSYKDLLINPDQKVNIQRGRTFTGVLNSSNESSVAVLEKRQDEELKIDPLLVTGEYVITGPVNAYSKNCGLFPLPPYCLVSLKDGNRKILNNISVEYFGDSFYASPDGHYFVYYDAKQNSFYSITTTDGSSTNITKEVPVRLSSDRSSNRTLDNSHESVSGVVGWNLNGRSVLINDQFDIWELDLTGKEKPMNITNGFGRRNHVEFRLMNGPESSGDARSFNYVTLHQSILIGFNTLTKENGFYTISAKGGNPVKLSMGPFTYYMQESMKPHGFAFSNGVRPVKADSVNLWIVWRESLTDAPNFFTTHDFRSYSRITDLRPQAKYQWMSDTLITWKLPDGRVCQGILFKPEHLIPNKKYPVIIHYYESLSHELNQFPYPGFTGADLDIPWFVANGYLVFDSDIAYKPGITAGEAALMCTSSAAEHLCKITYVDGAKIGLQGHSFGGYETNYIISHSHRFVAAAEFAGVSDPISGYLTLTPFMSTEEHLSAQANYESGHSNFGATPWQRPDVYLDNSAVFHADRITTPLLISHNKKDNNIPWRQGVELYMALRRLKKPVWMLQYENSGHSNEGVDAKDCTIRLTQFFDYYLKGLPPPIWMTRGIPVELENSDTGYELDRSGAKP